MKGFKGSCHTLGRQNCPVSSVPQLDFFVTSPFVHCMSPVKFISILMPNSFCHMSQ